MQIPRLHPRPTEARSPRGGIWNMYFKQASEVFEKSPKFGEITLWYHAVVPVFQWKVSTKYVEDKFYKCGKIYFLGYNM